MRNGIQQLMKNLMLVLAVFVLSGNSAMSQGFLRAEGTKIVDGSGNNFISRSIGTGNWMIQEGYMMQSTGAGINTQWQFREKLIEEIGEEKTDIFYDEWLANHFTRADLDSMKAWGFNSIRPALHYKWFTLPIEDEPIPGENTWLEKGFEMLDELIAWSSENEMYVFLDMHGAPGGQGKNADISDYDPSKPSLWESEYNLSKLTALWYKIAERYKDEPWVGGFDLINEINWDFENSGNENGCNCTQNKPIIDIFERMIDTIRTVNTNHIVFVSGNCWGNNYNGMHGLADYDDNLVFTFHKYWNFNTQSSLEWILEMRENLNVPLWMSESGENSNTWFTNATSLFESNNIGWSWWPVKKSGINNVLRVVTPQEYTNLLNYWQNGTPQMNEEQIFEAVMKWAESHKIENCIVQYDVIDALTRQIDSYEAIPFKEHVLGEVIFFTDYDLGRNNVAYFDNDTANHHLDTGTFTAWNRGWSYRNDGVDIEPCSDEDQTNGYNVGWFEPGEWMQYTFNSDAAAAYTFTIRFASNNAQTSLRLQVNDVDIAPVMTLPSTGGWQNWETFTIENVVLPEGEIVFKVTNVEGGGNLNYFKFSDPVGIDQVDFEAVAASTSYDGDKIFLSLNSVMDGSVTIPATTFSIYNRRQQLQVERVKVSPLSDRILEISMAERIYYGDVITIHYAGSNIQDVYQRPLQHFSVLPVLSNVPTRLQLPGRVSIQDYYNQEGLSFEQTEDAENPGGLNLAYTNHGDFIDFLVTIKEEGTFEFNYSVAATASNGIFEVQLFDVDNQKSVVGTYSVPSTGGWQNWRVENEEITLPAGHYRLRIYIVSPEFNMSWFEMKHKSTSSVNSIQINTMSLFPNPCRDSFEIAVYQDIPRAIVNIYNVAGTLVKSRMLNLRANTKNTFMTSALPGGMYLVQVVSDGILITSKLKVIH
ncbi:carbohydrate-binding protein [Alkalitalea saponilacus]|uniref:Por secretion system C-terminal sorting domain-containing protein n=1 Tax=Alkalitalea saponilacus TaxID=889453 RepID=A0A1T5AYF4_9BACT|nr:carbohydrate-binding protein [Alkalitalea saponilacus]ASB48549.1 glycoside hydrolase family 5 [Alkalitalea saponilacus]SKB40015.1 Por secretion system C-terminal sorting domain-containing protein [Alkalitalea saponilacus]